MPYKDPQKQRAYFAGYQRKRRAENPEPSRAAGRKWRAEHPEAMRKNYRKWGLKTSYGLTEEDVRLMFDNQEGLCGVCSRLMCRCGLPRGKCPTQAEVEHDHSKKGRESVRGLVCSTCNKGMGSLKDSPLLLRSAAHYLEAGRSPWVN